MVLVPVIGASWSMVEGRVIASGLLGPWSMVPVELVLELVLEVEAPVLV